MTESGRGSCVVLQTVPPWAHPGSDVDPGSSSCVFTPMMNPFFSNAWDVAPLAKSFQSASRESYLCLRSFSFSDLAEERCIYASDTRVIIVMRDVKRKRGRLRAPRHATRMLVMKGLRAAPSSKP
eukprot:1152423-Pelagomonas_calceolata.AAC.5